ncbi:MAG: competence/damage-inducible protein A [Kiritimatiellae bacterium]|nr:competence/damage-inducible protein A [Kiritimatiellia bacterium]
MQAIIISVGDELTLGQTVDTNSAWLSARLAELGTMTRAHLTVPDDQAAIVRAVRQASELAEWVVITGGLGPTKDDLTRQALAEVQGGPMVMHAPSLAKIEQFFKDRGRVMTESNRVQSLAPAGAMVLDNPQGTAPGLRLAVGRAQVFSMPGVPLEMKAMFEQHLAPLIAAQAGRTILTRKINTLGIGESMVGEALGDLMRRDRNPVVGTTVSSGIVSVRIRSDFPTRVQAQAELDRTASAVKDKLGTAVFSEGDVSLAVVVGELLQARHRTVATAESCTAGLVAAMLTEVPLSSAWFLGGWVVYANRMKTEALGVPSELIAREGAVSEQVVRRMAAEALQRSAGDYALALTGVAGPGGGSPEKPVGTVWIGLGKNMAGQVHVAAERFLLFGDRAMVRERAAKTALNMLRLELLKTDDR